MKGENSLGKLSPFNTIFYDAILKLLDQFEFILSRNNALNFFIS